MGHLCALSYFLENAAQCKSLLRVTLPPPLTPPQLAAELCFCVIVSCIESVYIGVPIYFHNQPLTLSRSCHQFRLSSVHLHLCFFVPVSSKHEECRMEEWK